MFLKEIHLRNFRNYAELVLPLSPTVNILLGENGEGKTNLLEAIYFLANLRSFRTSSRAELLQWGTHQAYVKGILEHHYYPRDLTIEIIVEKARRVLRVNGKEPEKISEFLGLVNTFVFFPDSLLLVKGGPPERRKFFDRGIYNLRPRYLELVQEYNHALRQRNTLLKTPYSDPALFEVWTKHYMELGTAVTVQRLRYLHDLSTDLQRVKEDFLPEPQNITLCYTSALGDSFRFPLPDMRTEKEPLHEDIRARFQQRVKRREREERKRQQSLVGPHRDDIHFLLDGKDLHLYGSQGEQRIVIFLLILAMLRNFTRHKSLLPIVLLDDVVAELDKRRRSIVFDFLTQGGQQVFVTTAEPIEFGELIQKQTLYRVVAGGVQRY
jgi:DNA replication and repair protein RecF